MKQNHALQQHNKNDPTQRERDWDGEQFACCVTQRKRMWEKNKKKSQKEGKSAVFR